MPRPPPPPSGRRRNPGLLLALGLQLLLGSRGAAAAAAAAGAGAAAVRASSRCRHPPTGAAAPAFLSLSAPTRLLQQCRRRSLVPPLAAASVPTVPPGPRPAASAAVQRAGGATEEMEEEEEEEDDPWVPRAVYIHLPFCRRRCYYCDFPIKVVGDRPGAADAASEEYVELLLRELAATVKPTTATAAASPPPPPSIDAARIRAAGGLTSVFFGGGTPSLTPPRLVRRVVEALRAEFGLADGVEISMEMDPGTFDGPRLRAFLDDCGVTRVSMGVQAFDAGLLAACGRAHSLEDVHTAVATLKSAGFENWSVDLIGGLPGQTMAQWTASVEAAIASGAKHVSVYDLQVEAGTAFGRWYGAEGEDNEDTAASTPPSKSPPQQQQPRPPKRERPAVAPLPREELAAEMFAVASSKLRAAGFTHYELSNYAKGPRHECRHNRVYWEGKAFLALGMGAASYVGWHRFARPRSLSGYRAWVALLEDAGWGVATGYAAARAQWTPVQWAVERLEDLLMVGLRLKEGVALPRAVEAQSGLAAAVGKEKARAVLRKMEEAVVPRFVARGAAVYDEGKRKRLVLTDPEGLLVSNEVISELYAAVGRVLELEDERDG